MEDVLEVYQRPTMGMRFWCWMRRPNSKSRRPRPRPQRPESAAYDYEYKRNGVSSLFMLFAPITGWRRVEVRERRTKVDFVM